MGYFQNMVYIIKYDCLEGIRSCLREKGSAFLIVC